MYIYTSLLFLSAFLLLGPSLIISSIWCWYLLGPLLFILYTNDFENSLSTFYSNMYADDTSISASSENPVQLIEHLKRELEGIMDWLRQNKLSLNVAKCEYMFIGNDKELSKISDIGNLEIDKDEIKRVRKTKYLRLTLDESLSWSQQYKLLREN